MIKAGQRPFRRDKQDIRALGRMLSDPFGETDIIADQPGALDTVKLKGTVAVSCAK